MYFNTKETMNNVVCFLLVVVQEVHIITAIGTQQHFDGYFYSVVWFVEASYSPLTSSATNYINPYLMMNSNVL